MKAITAVCASGAASVGSVTAGRVHRQRRDVENEEIQMYLAKLKELVPMPKNRRLSKLEVIQYVIDYICELQYTLETHPSVATAVGNVTTAVTTTTTTTASAASSPVHRLTNSTTVNNGASVSPRQPLGVLAPNTIVPNTSNTSCATQEQISTTPIHLEKVTPPDSRPVSC